VPSNFFLEGFAEQRHRQPLASKATRGSDLSHVTLLGEWYKQSAGSSFIKFLYTFHQQHTHSFSFPPKLLSGSGEALKWVVIKASSERVLVFAPMFVELPLCLSFKNLDESERTNPKRSSMWSAIVKYFKSLFLSICGLALAREPYNGFEVLVLWTL
jgi:hypothetical protein